MNELEKIKSEKEKEYLDGRKLTVEVIFKISSELLVGEELIIKPPESSELLRRTLGPLSEVLASRLLSALGSTLGIWGISSFEEEIKILQEKIVKISKKELEIIAEHMEI